MPMVSESYSDKDIYLPGHRNGSDFNVLVHSGVSKSQYGYRSRSLTQEEELGIRGASVAGNVTSLIGFTEETGYSYARKHSRAFLVNDRDYTEYKYYPGSYGYNVVYQLRSGTTAQYDIQSPFSVRSMNTSGFMPTSPPTYVLENIAGRLMRQSVPSTKVNLVRFAGEQRDAPALFRAANYRPRNIHEAGGAYLNYVFGIAPTLSDLSRMADTIILSDKVIRDHLEAVHVRKKVSRNYTVWEDSKSGLIMNKFTNRNQPNQTFNFGDFTAQMSYATTDTSGGQMDVLVPRISYLWTASQRVRQFATWEYFVPAPEKLLTRLDKYKKLASDMVGEGASPGTVWNLTPYTWMSDWLVDFGGLLHYQQAVSDNQVVSTGSGYSYWEEAKLTAHVLPQAISNVGVTTPATVLSLDSSDGMSMIQMKRHKRRGGNPYSIGPSWTSLSLQQWAILGAMGLSRGSGVPIKR